MFTIKCYTDSGRCIIREAESFTILGDAMSGESEITLHHPLGDCRIDIIPADRKREDGWPPVFQWAYIENGLGKTVRDSPQGSLMMITVHEGSDAEFNSMLRGESPELQPDPRIDRVFTLMRGEPVPDNVVALAQPKTDEERATEYKAQLREHAEKLCEVMTAARRDGFILSWQAGWDVAGRAFVQSVDAMKPL